MRSAPRALLAGGLGFAMSFIVACGGGSGLLSSDQANTLNRQLDTVSSALSSGQCTAAAGAASDFGNAVANLPASVSPKLTSNLSQGAQTLQQLAARDCHQQTSSTATNTVSTNTTTTHTSTPSTTPSHTTPPTPTQTTPATTPAQPGTTSTGGGTGGAGLPGAGNGGSGGSGANGNGNGQ